MSLFVPIESLFLPSVDSVAMTTCSDMVDDLQVEVASLKAQLDSLNQEKQMDMERIEDLVAQTARFELENKNKCVCVFICVCVLVTVCL